ncbi:MAG TPA: MmgE/PrpD family protein [Burkholderiales bacterium]|nr:MmgE/PrpD family protein [Burkholderiales bacterium]
MSERFTETLANFAIETRSADILQAALAAARDAVTDTLGVALAGAREPAGEIAARWMREVGAAPRCTVWGQALSSSTADAAFANAIASHALDFDDTHPGTRGHSSATLVPAALAVGEARHSSGVDVLAAYAIGLEVAGKIGRAFGPGHLQRGWHPTATVGIFGATTVAARLVGLDAEALRRAWGLAASQMGGLVRNFGTMAKPFHAGHAARCGVLAAWLAGEGYTSDGGILDGPGGVLEVYRGTDGAEVDRLVSALGQNWEVLDPGNYVKRWPCCYSNHRAVGGLLQLIQEKKIAAEEVQEIAVGFLPGTDTALVSRDPHTGLEGKFSVEYVLAALLIDGALTLETFTDQMVQRPGVRHLMRKVRRQRIPDDKVYSGIAGYTDLSVTTSRGKHERRIDRVPGSPAWPLTAVDREAKFTDCATRALGAQGAARLLDTARRLLALADVSELVRAAGGSSHGESKAQRAR